MEKTFVATHHINKLIADFSFPPAEKDIAINKAKALLTDIACNQLQMAFDETHTYVYIEKLEIDIGNTSEADFADKFSAALSGALPKSLNIPVSNTSTLAAPASATKSKPDISVDDFISFLQQGYWPWYIQQKENTHVIGLIKKLFQEKRPAMALLSQIRNSPPIAVKRLSNLVIHTSPIQLLFSQALLLRHPYLEKINSFFEKVYLKFTAGRHKHTTAFIEKLYTYPGIDSPVEFNNFMVHFLKEAINSAELSITQLALLHQIQSMLTQLPQPVEEEILLEKISNFVMSSPAAKQIEFETKFSLDSLPESLNNEKEKISITNAGLIILHPYLPFLFRELGWVNEQKNFVSKQLQQKAVLFLQYIINGKSRQQEYILVLNKILCGWPVDMPLQLKCNFSASEKKAAEEMLDSFIEHWSVLRNTSRNGLVNSFIDRKGLVQKTGNHFLLQVEKKSIDILLDSLPFGISTIKLPWNEHIIYTEWAY